jgi:hypothetical protein
MKEINITLKIIHVNLYLAGEDTRLKSMFYYLLLSC